MSSLLIVLQEKDGKFGPKIEKDLYKADNILALASTSDSWTGQKEKKFDTIDKLGKEINILTIPAGTTGMIQPLDV
ncbi:pogo transposable element with krab domain [Lasius niger]|uniref:Pogo transposable element with krab domain n=1 Tax=Lasius niger TaxID=67767 RepID=A0A0J7K8X2_LASNI|nr:pogo transposable element with krab domain [Lasius niger]